MYSAEDETRGADASQLCVAASNTRRIQEDLKPITGGRSEKKSRQAFAHRHTFALHVRERLFVSETMHWQSQHKSCAWNRVFFSSRENSGSELH
jgi:hypothetical protein